jgi:hypothetical protein
MSMFGKLDLVLLGCPATVSGGPEAVHQLAQIINQLGVEAWVLYGGAQFRIQHGKLLYEAPTNNPTIEAYRHYLPIPARSVTLTERTLMIMPETFANVHNWCAPAYLAYWWLSWDNAFHFSKPLGDRAYQAQFFAKRDLLHLVQTFRAHIHLREKGVSRILDLTDYTDERFTRAKPHKPNDIFRVAYNPRKAGELAREFFERNPDISAHPITAMSKDQVHETLCRTMIYVEFGNNPGNDRLPREAACVGCIILAKRAGGSAWFEDVPLDDCFKFSEREVHSGKLADMIRAISRDPMPYFQAQSYYRNHLYLEKEQMILQVRRLLGA